MFKKVVINLISKEELKMYANKLCFDMNDDEYETLQKEFEVILKQMDLISKIENISDVEPMVYPFEVEVSLREDIVNTELNESEVIENAYEVEKNQVKLPKVVE